MSRQTVLVRDARLPGAAPPQLVAVEGPASVTYQRVLPPNQTSTNPTFTIDLPSQMTGLQRTLYWQMAGTFTITGVDLDTLASSERIALRAFPLQSMCNSVQIQLNDTTVSLGSLNRYIAALLRVGNPSDCAAGVQSSAPAAHDWASEYDDMVARANSPFRAPGDGPVSNYDAPPRTIGITDIVYNGTTEIVVSFEVREPIIVSPFGYTNKHLEKALYGLNQIQVTCNMGNFHRGLSLALGIATVSSVDLAINEQAMLCTFITPEDRSAALAMQSRASFAYEYNSVQAFYSTLTSGAVIAGASFSGSSNTFQLPVVPERILVYATYSEADRSDASLSLTDAFMPIESCQIQCGTRSGVLSGANSQQLWRISWKNGGHTPYWNFSGIPQRSSSAVAFPRGSGGPLVLDVAEDLELPEGVTPGMRMNWQFSVTNATFTNRFGRTITSPQLVVVAITGGVLTNGGGSSSIELGGVPGLDSEAFRDAAVVSSEEYHALNEEAGFGGKHGRRARAFFRHLGHSLGAIAKKALPFVEMAAPEIAPEAEIAKAALGGAMLGGAMLGGAPLGGALLGGQRMPRGKLYRR